MSDLPQCRHTPARWLFIPHRCHMDYQHVNQITDAINGLSYAIRSLNEPLGWIAIAAVVSTLVFVVRTIFGK